MGWGVLAWGGRLAGPRREGARGARPEEQQGAGQGKPKPGDVFSDPSQQQGPGEKGAGGRDEGEVQLLLEFKVDDIVDWLWEEMKLPNLKARVGPSDETDWTREGWDRRGARSRLHPRRSLQGRGNAAGGPGATRARNR